MLGRHGCRMLRAKNGAEGERLFAEHAQEIAFVMLDCRLPDMDGTELGERLRQIRPGLPVLFTSGQGYAGQRTFTDGATGFLAKPFMPAEFTRQVSAFTVGTA
jgi:CheY-like chemotaxis protein